MLRGEPGVLGLLEQRHAAVGGLASAGGEADGALGTVCVEAGRERGERLDRRLRESVLRPTAKVVAGYQPVMPTFQGVIDEEGVLQLIAYIKSLRPEGS